MSFTIDWTPSGMHNLSRITPIALATVIVCASVDVVAQAPTPPYTRATTKQRDPSVHAPAESPTARATSNIAQRSPAAAEARVVARVGDTDLDEEAVRAMLAGLGARDQAALARDPALSSQLVRSMLANQLVLKEARAKHWDQQPEVAEQIQRAQDAAIVDSYLRSVSRVPDGFPDEAAIQNVYEANKTAFLVPRQFLVAQIYVALHDTADKATAEKAAKKFGEIQHKLKAADADFAAIARTHSDAKETGENGGEIAWVSEVQLRPEIKASVIGLSKGAVSDPIKLDDGWHIIKLVDTKAAYTRPLSEVRAELAQRIRDEQATANRRNYLAELLKKHPPAINEIELARILNESRRPSTH